MMANDPTKVKNPSRAMLIAIALFMGACATAMVAWMTVDAWHPLFHTHRDTVSDSDSDASRADLADVELYAIEYGDTVDYGLTGMDDRRPEKLFQDMTSCHVIALQQPILPMPMYPVDFSAERFRNDPLQLGEEYGVVHQTWECENARLLELLYVCDVYDEKMLECTGMIYTVPLFPRDLTASYELSPSLIVDEGFSNP